MRNSKQVSKTSGHAQTYDLTSLKQILVDTVILPALSSKSLNIGDFPAERFKRGVLSDCRSVLKSLDLEQRFDLSMDVLLEQVDLDACYQNAMRDYICLLLRQRFSHDLSDNPGLFLDASDSNQDRLDLVLRASKWLYRAYGANPGISSTQAFNEVNSLFNEAQQSQLNHTISH